VNDGGSTDGGGDEIATVTAGVSVLGESTSVPVNVFEIDVDTEPSWESISLDRSDIIGTFEVGDAIELEDGFYALQFGDLSLASDASDGLPIFEAGDGTRWISPEILVAVGSAAEEITDSWLVEEFTAVENDTTFDASMNLFIEGTWTCWDSAAENVHTDTVEYRDGLVVRLTPVAG
jgi:hypothetical protein